MGFWHTGYMEFHEPVGLDDCHINKLPPAYCCGQCSETFDSIESLRQHRFERHPLQRPSLFLEGREMGSHPTRITRELSASDIWVEHCNHIQINGREIAFCELPGALAQISSDVCRLVLANDEVSSEFTLEFRIASEKDLCGVENEFERTARGKRLDTHTIEGFISSTAEYASAIGYCDGICSYLYGVLAKERAPDSTLPYEAYERKFNKAAEDLAVYNRPLAKTISSLIEFHFNHFGEAAKLGAVTRIGVVARKYRTWTQNLSITPSSERNPSKAPSTLETMVTDWETEQIARWAEKPLDSLGSEIDEIVSFLARDLLEYDRVKLHVLLAEIYSALDNAEGVLRYTKPLRNLSAFEVWAEAKIRRYSES